ncbi:gp53-like domain-containing protein [Novosphingobium resinovorum]|uniref:Tail fiber protein n=1 Tax=Novosphingobium resinovorum TaxID=158500 RepID=A0A1D8A2K6_9SPHN|nr:hypothetical protein [Novosphingobium resinovorum]AOR76348.1 hypothetical protein BES08_05930 [Novosphingobium resinovorum]
MQQSDLPARFNIPFANNAGASYIRQIPQAHQTPTTSDAPASLFDGFPPETFQPVASGGIPPSGADFNGLFNQMTAALRWLAAGGPSLFNAGFSVAIGGYPKGAILTSMVDPRNRWVSTVDNNTTDPDGYSPENWVKYGTQSFERDTSGNWKRTSPDGYIEMGGIYAGPISSGGEFAITFTFPFGGFPNEFLGMTAMTRNTTSSNDGDTTFQEISATTTSIRLFVQSDQGSGSHDRAGGFRWRAWGI